MAQTRRAAKRKGAGADDTELVDGACCAGCTGALPASKCAVAGLPAGLLRRIGGQTPVPSWIFSVADVSALRARSADVEAVEEDLEQEEEDGIKLEAFNLKAS